MIKKVFKIIILNLSFSSFYFGYLLKKKKKEISQKLTGVSKPNKTACSYQGRHPECFDYPLTYLKNLQFKRKR